MVVRQIVVEQDAFCIAVQIVILAAGKGPYQDRQTGQPHTQCGCDDQAHGFLLPPASRRALSVTSNEDPAMVAAAMSGVTNPKAAMGMAVAL